MVIKLSAASREGPASFPPIELTENSRVECHWNNVTQTCGQRIKLHDLRVGDEKALRWCGMHARKDGSTDLL